MSIHGKPHPGRRHIVLAIAASAALAGCEPKPTEAHSQTVGGLRLEYGIVSADRVAAHPAAHDEAQMHGGASGGADHVTLAVFDAKTNARVSDAETELAVQGPGHPGHDSIPLEPMTINGDTTYGGYISMRPGGRYRLTFRINRAGQRHDPIKARFAYERPQ